MKRERENLFKNETTATAVSNIILANSDFCNMYSLSNANMNTALTNNNRVVTVNETLELAKQIVETMKLQNEFFSAVSRITVWVDSNAIVVFVGAVFTVHSTLADIEKDKKDRLNELFNLSLDKKYNERKLKGKVITNLTETRHSFDSIETATEFINLLMTAIVARKKVLADSTAQQTETAQQTATKEKKAQQKQKQKRQQKQKKADISVVSADTLAELTKEVIEAEQKKA